jgi:phytoene dehydrogenase-like protein
MYKLAVKKGVTFLTGHQVTQINHRNGVVGGLTYLKNGIAETKEYDAVISNADAYHTYSALLTDKDLAKKYNSKELSSSAIIFYWGVKGIHENLDVHSILFSKNYQQEFEDIGNGKCPDDPTIYINISSRYNSSDAPERAENWFVMVNTPYDSGQDWDKEVIKLKRMIFNKVKTVCGIDLENNIVAEAIKTPVDLEKDTFALKGALYGISSNSQFAAFMRERNQSSKYKGLYFCGGTAHPGGGMPLVVLSGEIVSDTIQKRNL